MYTTQAEANEALLNAIRKDDIPSVNKALEHGADIFTNNNESEQDNVIMIAILRKATGCINTLLEAGANVNYQKFDGNTSLIYASGCGLSDIVEKLIRAEARIDAKDNQGRTALMMAAKHGHIDCLEKLINAGADIHHADSSGITALSLAALSNQKHIVRKLVAVGAKLDALSDTHKKTYANEIKEGTATLAERKWKLALQKQRNFRHFIRARR